MAGCFDGAVLGAYQQNKLCVQVSKALIAQTNASLVLKFSFEFPTERQLNKRVYKKAC